MSSFIGAGQVPGTELVAGDTGSKANGAVPPVELTVKGQNGRRRNDSSE